MLLGGAAPEGADGRRGADGLAIWSYGKQHDGGDDQRAAGHLQRLQHFAKNQCAEKCRCHQLDRAEDRSA